MNSLNMKNHIVRVIKMKKFNLKNNRKNYLKKRKKKKKLNYEDNVHARVRDVCLV